MARISEFAGEVHGIVALLKPLKLRTILFDINYFFPVLVWLKLAVDRGSTHKRNQSNTALTDYFLSTIRTTNNLRRQPIYFRDECKDFVRSQLTSYWAVPRATPQSPILSVNLSDRS